jgi:hypothetical protein
VELEVFGAKLPAKRTNASEKEKGRDKRKAEAGS